MVMKRWIFSLICFTASALAQGTTETVVPFGFENQSGNGSDSLLDFPGQTQELFRASYLANAWDTPVAISGIAFRVAGALSMSATIPQVEIRFSTSSQTPETMSTFYAANKGADETTVFLHNNVSLFGTAGQQVNPFDLRFQFDRPFIYDPKNGNLLMSIKLTGSFLGGKQIDAQGYSTLAASPVGYVGQHNPDQVGALADVIAFSYVQVPEPRIPGLILIGGIALLGALKKK
jgi:hypothetical protein